MVHRCRNCEVTCEWSASLSLILGIVPASIHHIRYPSPHLTSDSSHVTSRHLTSPHLTSPHLILSRLISPLTMLQQGRPDDNDNQQESTISSVYYLFFHFLSSSSLPPLLLLSSSSLPLFSWCWFRSWSTPLLWQNLLPSFRYVNSERRGSGEGRGGEGRGGERGYLSLFFSFLLHPSEPLHASCQHNYSVNQLLAEQDDRRLHHCERRM